MLTAGNWQSPSFLYSEFSQAGRETGTIRIGVDDYKRDIFPDEREYGRLFVKEYVDSGLRLQPVAFPTSSGMSAITTILGHLRKTVPADAVILAGSSTYFQTKWVLEQLFPGKVHYIDETDTERIVAFVQEHQPPIVFLDSIGNSPELLMPNLPELLPRLSSVLSSHSTLVFDNTTTATTFQPLRFLPTRITGVRVIVVESLLKYHQCGFDRVNGGIIWTLAGLSIQDLGHARIHMGTNISDVSLCALPSPNRALLERRLLRIGRNARRLAERLDQALVGRPSVVSRIVYPSLKSHPSSAWAQHLPFCGGFFVFEFAPGKKTFGHYDAFLSKVFSEAKKRNVAIVGGTSFGFNTTRVHIPGRTGLLKDAFVRVSVGTETAQEIEALGDVFVAALF